jgi:hypothetical protein
MPKITAIVHTSNDALRIGRAVESLRSCDEVLVADHSSSDGTTEVARAFGARVIAVSGAKAFEGAAAQATHDWLLCLLPTEAVAELLEAELFEFKNSRHALETGFAIPVLEETSHEWILRAPEVRLVQRGSVRWQGPLPAPPGAEAKSLAGCLLRLRLP